MSSYAKIPASGSRAEKLAKAGRVANKKRSEALKAQAETASRLADELEKSLEQDEVLLQTYDAKMFDSIVMLRRFVEEAKSKTNEVIDREIDADPVDFYANYGSGVEKAVKGYLRGEELAPDMNDRLIEAGIDPSML